MYSNREDIREYSPAKEREGMAGLEVPGNAHTEGCATLGICDRNCRECQPFSPEEEGLLLHSAMYRAEVHANGHGLQESKRDVDYVVSIL